MLEGNLIQMFLNEPEVRGQSFISENHSQVTSSLIVKSEILSENC